MIKNITTADNLELPYYLNGIVYELTKDQQMFSFDDLLQALEWDSPVDYEPWDVEDFLYDNPDIAILPGKKETYFFSRKAFFSKSEFLVKLSDFELNNSIFFIGHRLIPFFPEDLSQEAQIFFRDEELSFKQIEVPIGDASICYSLNTPGNNIFNIVKDFDPDTIFEQNFDAEVKLEAFDISDFINENNFKSGDYIKFTIRDYDKTQCDIEKLPAKSLKSNIKGIQNWRGKFESGLKKAIRHQKAEEEPFSNDELLAVAFYYAGKALLKNPISNWLTTLQENKKFTLQEYDGDLLIWEKDKLEDYMDSLYGDEDGIDSILDILDEQYPDSEDPEDMDFNDICHIVGFSMNEDVILAYMLDAIHFNKSLKDLKKHCFDGRIEKYYPELNDRFDTLLNELWKKAENTKSEFRTMEMIKLRHEALILLDAETAFIRELDHFDCDPEILLSPEFKPFGMISSSISALILQLGHTPLENSDEYKKADKLLKATKGKFFELINKLRKKFIN